MLSPVLGEAKAFNYVEEECERLCAFNPNVVTLGVLAKLLPGMLLDQLV